MGGPSIERPPPVLDSCTQVEESTRDEPAYIERREGGKGGGSLGVSLLCHSLELKIIKLAVLHPVIIKIV